MEGESENLDFLKAKQKREEIQVESTPVKKNSKVWKILMLVVILVLILAIWASLIFMA